MPGIVLNELSHYLMLKINCCQRGYSIRPDPNLGPECQEGEGCLNRPNARLWVCEYILWSIVDRSVIKSVLNFSKDIDQAHFLCRWRPLQCATSFPQSSLRTRRTGYLLCQAYNQVTRDRWLVWATYSKQFSRLPVVIDRYWQSFLPFLRCQPYCQRWFMILQAIVSAVLKGFKDKREHYYTAQVM